MGINDHTNDSKRGRQRTELADAVEFGIVQAIDALGGSLSGINLLNRGYDTLAVVKVEFEGRPMVAFCGAGSMAACLRKVAAEARSNKLKWKPDKFGSR